MSNSTEFWDFSAQKLPEKKKQRFSETCSRLSHYLKENGSFGDLSLDMTCNGGFGELRKPKVMNLFPCEALVTHSPSIDDQGVKPSFSSSSLSEVVEKSTTKTVKPECRSSPLTIFYGGQAFVFDGLSAEKAKEVIDLANNVRIAKSVTEETNHNEIDFSLNLALCPAKTAAQELIQPDASSLTCEFPIARKASLDRFLEKRKDRIASKSPYQINKSDSDYSLFGA